MTRKSEQLRAVFLAALMVISVFGMTVAFSGSAAAGTYSDVSIAENDIGENTTYTATYTVGTDISKLKKVNFTTGGDVSNVAKEDITVTIAGTEYSGSEISGITLNSGKITITFASTHAVSSGDTLVIEAKNVKTPTDTTSTRTFISLVDDGGNQRDSAEVFYSVDDTVPSISQFSASYDGSNVNVSFVSNQSLNLTDGNTSVKLASTGNTIYINNSVGSGFTEELVGTSQYLYYNDTVSAAAGEYTATLTKGIDSDSGFQDAANGQSDTVIVDNKKPVFDYKSPANNSKLTSVPSKIDVAINDSLSAINKDSVTVTLKTGGGYTFVDEVDVTRANDGISFTYAEGDQTTGNLTIVPDNLPIKSFPDGDINVKVTAADAATNQNTTNSYSFHLDTGASFGFSLDTPKSDLINSNPSYINVTVDNSTDEFDYSNLSIKNSSQTWEFSSADSVYNDTSDPHSYNVSTGGGDIPNLVDDTYTVTVNATDKAENTASDKQFTFTLDTTSPNVTSVSVENATVIDNGSQTISVDFDEPVNNSTVAAEITNGSETASVAAGNFTQGSDADKSTVVATITDISTFDKGVLDDIENESILVNVTAGQDIAGNGLGETKNTTFEIDTDEPTITNTIPDTLDAYTNLTKYVTPSSGDGETVTYYIKKDGEDDSYEEIQQDVEHFDASQYPEDVYKISVNVTDDNGNTNSTTNVSVVDLKSPSISTTFDENQRVAGNVSVNSSFSVSNNDSDVTWTFKVHNASDGSEEATIGSSGEWNSTSFGQEDAKKIIINATATEDNGAQETVSKNVTLVVDEVNVTSGNLAGTGSALEVNVTTDEQVDSIVAYVNDSDDFRNNVSKKLTESDFGTPTATGDDWKYTTEIDVRDGQYTLNVKKAANNSREDVTLSGNEAGDTELDNSNATVTDADIIGADGVNTKVELKFDEPVADNLGAENITFRGTEANSSAAPSRQTETGTVVANFSGAIQTGDDTDVNVTNVDEEYGDNQSNSSTTVATIELDLKKGWNMVSIPEASGTTPSTALGNNVAVVWKYDASSGEWTSDDPDTQTDGTMDLKGGEGYLVKMETDESIDMVLDNVPSGQQAPATQDISAGWNLVGHYQEGQQSADTAFNTMAPTGSTTGDIVDSVYGQASAGELRYNAVANDANLGSYDLQPGDAYWVFVKDDTSYSESAW